LSPENSGRESWRVTLWHSIIFVQTSDSSQSSDDGTSHREFMRLLPTEKDDY